MVDAGVIAVEFANLAGNDCQLRVIEIGSKASDQVFKVCLVSGSRTSVVSVILSLKPEDSPDVGDLVVGSTGNTIGSGFNLVQAILTPNLKISVQFVVERVAQSAGEPAFVSNVRQSTAVTTVGKNSNVITKFGIQLDGDVVYRIVCRIEFTFDKALDNLSDGATNSRSAIGKESGTVSDARKGECETCLRLSVEHSSIVPVVSLNVVGVDLTDVARIGLTGNKVDVNFVLSRGLSGSERNRNAKGCEEFIDAICQGVSPRRCWNLKVPIDKEAV